MVNETASSKRGVNPLCSLQSLGSKIRHCARQSVEKAFDGTPKLSQAVSQPTKKKRKSYCSAGAMAINSCNAAGEIPAA
jgi:hypothetical protein